MSDPVRVMALGFDAGAGELVRRWAAEGELPVLRGLMDGGATAPLASIAEFLPESIWASITTGCGPGAHGAYNWRETRPGTYVRGRRPLTPKRPPFWNVLRGEGRPAADAPRAVLLDVHGAVRTDDPGVAVVSGWGLRGSAPHETESSPPGELDRVIARHGRYATNLNRDVTGRPLLERSQLRTLERMTARRVDILLDLMERHPWEVCSTIFFETHYAGHTFHQYARRDAYIEPVPGGRGIEDGLLRVYKAADSGIGRLIDAAPAGTHVAVFSGMGMRPNTNGVTLLPRALEALGYTVPATASPTSRRREQMRRAALTVVPRPLARAVRRRFIDSAEVDRHAERLWFESTDWPSTRAWAEAEQGSGFIRLNVAGREPDGIVQRGEDYDRVCAQIKADLLELREADSGRPAVEAVVHRSEVTSGPLEDSLPDLLIKWSSRDVVRRAWHPRVGMVEDDGSDWQVSEHNDDGWLVMSGPLVRPGARADGARVEDLGATLTHLMGGELPEQMDGRVLTELLTSAAGPVRRAAPELSDDAPAVA